MTDPLSSPREEHSVHEILPIAITGLVRDDLRLVVLQSQLGARATFVVVIILLVRRDDLVSML